MKEEVINYLRLDDRFPHILCPGCGIGTIANQLVRALIDLKLAKEKVCIVSGIGCSSRVPGYLDCDTFHTLHGRAIPCAIGVKMARPEMEVIVIGGDGDILAIGLSHFIHAARRNIDLTVIIVNNFNYGMTGGQVSPTTPRGFLTLTTPYRNPEREFELAELSKAAGCVFFARTTTYHVRHLREMIKRGIEKKGFAVIEVISQCPTFFGRVNRIGDGVEMLKYFKEKSVDVKSLSGKEFPRDKIVIGVLYETESEEFLSAYKETLGR
jgi:2-oxoglutarate ferredoxin oxidoreductase subunit beta